MTAEELIDQKARDEAAWAHKRLDSHEDQCKERFKAVQESIKTLHDDISRDHSEERRQIDLINNRFTAALWRGLVVMAAMLAAVVGILFQLLHGG